MKRSLKKKTYHHEDLRRAMLDAGLAFLQTKEASELTIQVLARASGVSRGAPYHHFSDKASLLAALAEEGYAHWLRAAEEATALAKSPEKGLAALAEAWLDFTQRHHAHYKVMFLREVEDRQRFESLHQTSGRALAHVVQLVSKCSPLENNASHVARAVGVWSTLHGFASLQNGGILTNIPGLPSLPTLTRQVVAQVVALASAQSDATS
jgi:AcrR family transcriptional regulator